MRPVLILLLLLACSEELEPAHRPPAPTVCDLAYDACLDRAVETGEDPPFVVATYTRCRWAEDPGSCIKCCLDGARDAGEL